MKNEDRKREFEYFHFCFINLWQTLPHKLYVPVKALLVENKVRTSRQYSSLIAEKCWQNARNTTGCQLKSQAAASTRSEYSYILKCLHRWCSVYITAYVFNINQYLCNIRRWDWQCCYGIWINVLSATHRNSLTHTYIHSHILQCAHCTPCSIFYSDNCFVSKAAAPLMDTWARLKKSWP